MTDPYRDELLSRIAALETKMSTMNAKPNGPVVRLTHDGWLLMIVGTVLTAVIVPAASLAYAAWGKNATNIGIAAVGVIVGAVCIGIISFVFACGQSWTDSFIERTGP